MTESEYRERTSAVEGASGTDPKRAAPESREKSVWGSYASFGADPASTDAGRERARPGPVAPPAAGNPADVDCLVLGPAGAGKTSLISALEQGCVADGTFDRFTHLVAEPDLVALSAMARDSAFEGRAFHPEPTDRVAVYRFEAGRKEGDRSSRALRTRLIELPPRLFESPAAGGAIELTAPIAVMAVCLDVADLEGTRRWLDELVFQLRRLSLPIDGRRRAAGWLPFDRLLLIFNKADLLAEGVQRELSRPGRPASFSVDWNETLASIDPVELLLQVLGRQALRRLLRSLDPAAKVAVALASAWGETIAGKRREGEWQPTAIGGIVEFLVRGIDSQGAVAFEPSILDAEGHPRIGNIHLQEPQK